MSKRSDEHRAKIEDELYHCLVRLLNNDVHAALIIRALKDGKIPNVTINYQGE